MPSPFALAFLMLFSATAFGADRSAAQDYPRKPIRIVTGEAGGEVVASTPDEFTAVLKSEMAKWSKVIRDAGIRAE